MKSYQRIISDDGYNSELAKNAKFSGIFDFPAIKPNKELIIPKRFTPYSRRKSEKVKDSFIMFFELDKKFVDFIICIKKYIKEILPYKGIITPDCSLYRNMPLALQIANTYINRLVGHYLQEIGMYVIPHVRWGDERSYTTILFNEKFAFIGLPKNSILSISTYGCIQGKENKYYFKEGLKNMLLELTPKIVLVYGQMPDSVFNEFEDQTKFIHYGDYIASKRRK